MCECMRHQDVLTEYVEFRLVEMANLFLQVQEVSHLKQSYKRVMLWCRRFPYNVGYQNG